MKQNRVALTIDIEDWYHLPAITGAQKSKYKDVPAFFENWSSRYDYLSEPTRKVLSLLKELNLKATFFIVADIVDKYPGLVENIVADGHEIACHGLHHACKIDSKTKQPLMSKTEFRERTIEAREILERVSRQKVIGYRAPNAYIAGWMIDILEEIGFKYDSSVSVNSIYNKSDCSLEGVSSIPYYPEPGSLKQGNMARSIVEIPWPFFSLVLKFPAGGGPLLRFFGTRYISLGIRESLKRGNTLFYFHPLDIIEELFPIYSFIDKLFWGIKGPGVEKKIYRILFDVKDLAVTCLQLSDEYEHGKQHSEKIANQRAGM